jgi:DNA-binding transcriptional regulator YdaS (Cro superfamily)
MVAAGLDTTTPQAALAAAVAHVGSQAALARVLSVSQPSVWKWINRGKPLPGEHVLLVEKETGVSRHDLRPDLYPREAVAAPAALGDMEPAR